MKHPQAIVLGSAIFISATAGLATSQSLTAPKPVLSEQAFIAAVVRSNDAEIASSRGVLKTSKSPAVREFATRMIEDHASSNVALEATARNAHVVLNERARGVAMKMAMSPDPAMTSNDRAYLQAQVAAHTDALSTVTAYAERGTNETLRTFASTQVPIVTAHLQIAQNDLAMLPRANPGASVAPIPPGGNAGARSTNGGEIAPNPTASPATTSSASPNPQPSTGLPPTPAPSVSPRI